MGKQGWSVVVAVAAALAVVLQAPTTHAAMVLRSGEFEYLELIPGDYGCDTVSGVDRDLHKPSPPLFWARVPVKAQSFVLMVDDVDNDLAVQWLVTNIPRHVRSLPAGASGVQMPEGAEELTNSFGFPGFAGFCPNNATHTYRFRLFAMHVPHVTLSFAPDAPLTAPAVTAQLVAADDYCAVHAGVYYAPAPCPVAVPPGTPCPCPGPNCPPACPVPLLPNGDCPCPGGDCPPLDRTVMRYVKPSESFRNHTAQAVPIPDVDAVSQFVDPSDPECRDRLSESEERAGAQVARAAEQRWGVRGSPGANSLVEDTPMAEGEAARRHVRGYSWPPPEVALVQEGEGERGSGDGISAGEAEAIADDDADRVAEGFDLSPNEGTDELSWGSVLGDTSLLQHTTTTTTTTTTNQATNNNANAARAGVALPGQGLVEEDVRVVSGNTLPNPALYASDSNDEQVKHSSGCVRNPCARKVVKRYSFTLWSPTVSSGDAAELPLKHTCHANTTLAPPSLPLAWRHMAADTRSVVLLMDDVTLHPDDDAYGRVLWLVTNIPESSTLLTEGASGTTAMPEGAQELVPFKAPCPRHGTSRMYRVRVFAMGAGAVEVKLPTQSPPTSKAVEDQLRPLITAAMVFSVHA